ncbi:predicted protein [Histoplasma capsulatum H143]|uniref:Uncharacterized protein n=1 Tax=Ajellomyces capsulatus (strain H143) TaxID=544712 RepID=C6HEM9_AJECH|nr:predicted protein [Histoplasma capsulatum H143]
MAYINQDQADSPNIKSAVRMYPAETIQRPTGQPHVDLGTSTLPCQWSKTGHPPSGPSSTAVGKDMSGRHLPPRYGKAAVNPARQTLNSIKVTDWQVFETKMSTDWPLHLSS